MAIARVPMAAQPLNPLASDHKAPACMLRYSIPSDRVRVQDVPLWRRFRTSRSRTDVPSSHFIACPSLILAGRRFTPSRIKPLEPGLRWVRQCLQDGQHAACCPYCLQECCRKGHAHPQRVRISEARSKAPSFFMSLTPSYLLFWINWQQADVMMQVLTPEEFVTSGEYLVKTCSTWTW